ncbi:hypothetical protein O181_058165 [Austropuccinia psidii MF-1]|uniref:Chromo domain-containing protein n=1 Tax=Austropuccinia psidii MF-1 TaxID=1389203 RepID=A0A9Q3EFZ6_9BASI|nr:hypothetical protein [Austropuccinia psidii MF-1]
MDLPTLSFHAFLGEKLDYEEEPEEIEPVLKEALSQTQLLKEESTTSPILSHCNPSLPNSVETDASYYSSAAVLSQVNNSGKHSIAFDCHKLLPAEINYKIHDKELLGIAWALKRWRAVPLSVSHSFEVLKDHSSLQYFMSSKFLSFCQARWNEFLSDFHFTINYRPGRNLSTAFHPKTYGQTERLNIILEQYIWIDLSTKLQSVQQSVKEELESEICQFKKYSDRKRTIPPDFQPGDNIWLASKNTKTTRPTKKLSDEFLGRFEVLKKIGSHAYHLKFPQQCKSLYPIFHVSLLESVKKLTISNQHQFSPPLVLAEEQEEWEVAQVLDSKLKRGGLWYPVKWKGFNEDAERTAFKLPSELTSAPDLVP